MVVVVKVVVVPFWADLCCDKWACKKPADFMDESAQFQELREDDNSASEITYGEVEQRLGQLQEHLNRLAPPRRKLPIGNRAIFSASSVQTYHKLQF